MILLPCRAVRASSPRQQWCRSSCRWTRPAWSSSGSPPRPNSKAVAVGLTARYVHACLILFLVYHFLCHFLHFIRPIYFDQLSSNHSCSCSAGRRTCSGRRGAQSRWCRPARSTPTATRCTTPSAAAGTVSWRLFCMLCASALFDTLIADFMIFECEVITIWMLTTHHFHTTQVRAAARRCRGRWEWPASPATSAPSSSRDKKVSFAFLLR